MAMSALDVQVGGNHYRKGGIQPVEYIVANNLGFCEGNVVKYVTRYQEKGGIADLEKARHYLDLLMELTSGSTESQKDAPPEVEDPFPGLTIRTRPHAFRQQDLDRDLRAMDRPNREYAGPDTQRLGTRSEQI